MEHHSQIGQLNCVANKMYRNAHGSGTVSQQGLLPTHQDPKLWLVETRTGQEREACIRLMQKSIDLARGGAPLAIKSCFVQDHLQVACCNNLKQSL